MSASSSIAAARRRRAGGAGGPTPQNNTVQQQQQQQQQTPPPSNAPINPFIILQQHHIKINKLEQIIQDIVSKETGRDITNSPSAKESSSPSTPSDVNINELSDLIMSRVESQLDLKTFYENDERLMHEIEGLKGIIQSQQVVINGFNSTLYTMLDKLNISAPDTVDTVDSVETVETVETVENMETVDSVETVGSVGTVESNFDEKVSTESFPKSVIIDEASNTIKEFIATSMLSNDDTNMSVIQQAIL
jgi:hypothetical protein